MLISHIGLPNMASLSVKSNGTDDVNSMINRPVTASSSILKASPDSVASNKGLGPIVSGCLSFWSQKCQQSPLAIADILHIVVTIQIQSIAASICIEPNLTVKDVLYILENILKEQRTLILDLFPYTVEYFPPEWKNIFPDLPIRRQISANDLGNTEMSRRLFESKRPTTIQKGADADYLYANKQKVTDMFLSFLMESNCTTDGSFRAARKAISVKEIFVKLDRRNVNWFAEFVIAEFIRAVSPVNEDFSADDKIAKLERRISRIDQQSNNRDQVLFNFITAMDSNSLNKALWASCLTKLSSSHLESRSTKFMSNCREVKKVVVLLRFLAKIMEQEPSSVSTLRQLILESVKHGHLSVHVWWLYQNTDIITDDIIQTLKDYVSDTGKSTNINRLVFSHVLNELFGENISLDCSLCLSCDNGTIDSDRSLSLSIFDLGREHCSTLNSLYKYCTEGICVSTASHVPTKSPSIMSSSSSSEAVTLRKIRPVTELSGDAFEDLKLQKNLRRWFWWMYPGLKDAVESICSYLVLNHANSDAEERKAKLIGCIPLLTPVIWNCLGEGRAELVALLEQLSIELLERQSSPSSTTFE